MVVLEVIEWMTLLEKHHRIGKLYYKVKKKAHRVTLGLLMMLAVHTYMYVCMVVCIHTYIYTHERREQNGRVENMSRPFKAYQR